MSLTTIIHPSRGRPHQSYATTTKWVARAGVPVSIVVSLDVDDIELDKYQDAYQPCNPGRLIHAMILTSENRSAIDAINNAMKVATGDIFIIVSDDTDCPQNWAVKLEAACKGLHDFVMKTTDGIQRKMITMPIFDRAYYNRDGYVYNPEYKHLFADTEYSEVAYKRKRVVKKFGLKFPHNHYSVMKRPPDGIHIRNEATYAQGKEVYTRRQKINFGL